MSKILITLMLSCALASAMNSKAQDSLKSNLSSEISKRPPLITVKGEELRRFPSGNFLDAVNGFFPWVFSLNPNANDFMFVVNGFLLTDINSISLNDIEEVSFCGTSLQGSFYPLTKAGTFYISTRKYNDNNPLISFNSQYNFISSSKRQTVNTTQYGPVYEEETKYKSRYALTNHASVLTGGKKWELYASAQLDNTALPVNDTRIFSRYQGITRIDTLLAAAKQQSNNFRSFARLNYKPANTLALGISGTYYNGTANNNSNSTSYTPDYKRINTGNSKTTLPYFNGAAFVDWQPLHNLSSHTSFEYTNEYLDYLNDGEGTLSSYSTSTNSGSFSANDIKSLKSSRSLLRNKTEYIFSSAGKLQAGVSNVFSYFNQTIKYHQQSVFQPANGGFPSSGGSDMFLKERLTSINPGFSISYNELVSLNAGFAFLINKGVSKYTTASRSNPYAALLFDVQKLLKLEKQFSRFDVTINYDNLNKNTSQMNWLPGGENLSLLQPSAAIGLSGFGFGTSVIPNPSLNNILLKNSMLSVEANTGFLSNRLSVGLAWRLMQSESIYYEQNNFPGGGGITIPLKGKQVQHSIAIYAAAAIIDQPQKKWKLRFNVLSIPRYNYIFDYKARPDIVLANQQVQLGLQNNFTYKNWFGQLNGLVAVNKKAINTFLLNYVTVGYQLAEQPKNFLKQTSLFLQARNILSSTNAKNTYGYYAYAGAGVNFTF